jgi:deoxycytidine triphosphate deaminase
MSILSQACIVALIKSAGMIRNYRERPNRDPWVEAASYDLRAGRAVWKDPDSGSLQMEKFHPTEEDQPILSLKPGQMVIVVTHEELTLPTDVCGTVYSRNRLQKDNILALNAGHVDPGYDGQIIIRLINLGSTIWTFPLGEPIFTIVFEQLQDDYHRKGIITSPKDHRSPSDTLSAACRTAEQAFSNPFHDLYQSEIRKQLIEHDNQLETTLREKLASEFFRKSHVQYLVIEVALALLAALVLVLKVPWSEIIKWLQ